MAYSTDEESLSPEELLAASLRAGNRVDIVIERDEFRENLVVGRSRLHDVTPEGHLILAQTTPPLHSSQKGRLLEITFLAKAGTGERGKWVRTGYTTPLREVRFNRSAGGGSESVLVVEAPRELYEVNLRMHFRMAPPAGVYMLIVPKDLRQIVDRDLVRFVETARADLLADEATPDDLLRQWFEMIKEILVKASRTKRSPGPMSWTSHMAARGCPTRKPGIIRLGPRWG